MERVKDISKIIIGKDMVLIKINPKDDTTKSGIILPDSEVKAKPDTGVVISIGSDITDIKVGDYVLDVAKAAISTFTYRKDKYLIPPRHFIRVAVSASNYE